MSRGSLLAVVRSQAAAATSQLGGAAQVALLLVAVGTNRETDAFFVLGSVLQIPITLYALGVLYPSWLVSAPSSVRRASAATAVASVAAVLAGTGFLLVLGYPNTIILDVALPIAVFAGLYAAAMVGSVALACDGRPVALAGLPAAGACTAVVGVLVADAAGWSQVPVMLWSEALGTAVASLAIATRFRTVRGPALDQAAAPSRRQLWGSAVLTSVSTTILQAALATLPAGATTQTSLALRIGGAATAVAVNAVLPLFINAQSFAESAMRRLVRVSLALTVPAAVIVRLAAGHHGLALDAAALSSFAAWTVMGTTDSVAVQSVMRSGAAQALLRTALMNVPVYAVGAGVAISISDPLALAVTALVSANLSAVSLLAQLRWRREVTMAVIVGVLSLVVPFQPWAALGLVLLGPALRARQA